MNGIIVVLVIVFVLIIISFLYLNLEIRLLINEFELSNLNNEEKIKDLIINTSKYKEHQRIKDLFIIEVVLDIRCNNALYKVYNERTTIVSCVNDFYLDNYSGNCE